MPVSVVEEHDANGHSAQGGTPYALAPVWAAVVVDSDVVVAVVDVVDVVEIGSGVPFESAYVLDGSTAVFAVCFDWLR